MCGFTPHPPIVVPEVGGSRLTDCEATWQAMRELAKRVRAAVPATVIIMSPHAPLTGSRVTVNGGRTLSGDLGDFGAPEITFKAENDLALARRIVGLSGGRATLATDWPELDHGVVVPGHFLDRAGVKARLVTMSMGLLPYAALFQLGQAIRQAVEEEGVRAVFLASGDLSHRLQPDAPAGFDPQAAGFDRAVVKALEDNDVEALRSIPADLIRRAGECGLRPAHALLGAVAGTRLKPELLSYEAPFGVGYAVFSFRSATGLVELARESLEAYVKEGRMTRAPTPLPEELSRRAGVFVSLKKRGQLRGCIGTTSPSQPNLAEETIHLAVCAGTEDPRFPPVTADELADLTYSVDVLGEPEPVGSMEQLDPKRYGVIVRRGRRQGLLLPDLEGVEDARQQVDIARRKAGIPAGEPVELFRFEVVRHH